MSEQTSVVELDSWIPQDSFGARLALIRQHLHVNVNRAALMCGLDGENWRNWESGKNPRDFELVCHKIAEATGCSIGWLMMGGAIGVKNLKEFTPPDLEVLPGGGESTLGDEDGPPEPRPRARLTLVTQSD
jgi:hypothetical protein